jgi:hypothetical protein
VHLLFQHGGGGSSLRWELASSPPVVLGTFAAILFCLVAALAGSRWAALALFPLALIWAAANQRVEGPTLLALSYSHGITVADLLSLVAVLVGAGRLLAWAGGSVRQRSIR